MKAYCWLVHGLPAEGALRFPQLAAGSTFWCSDLLRFILQILHDLGSTKNFGNYDTIVAVFFPSAVLDCCWGPGQHEQHNHLALASTLALISQLQSARYTVGSKFPENILSLLPLRVQVLNNHILTQNLYYKYYCPKPKYLIIGYLDPLGSY